MKPNNLYSRIISSLNLQKEYTGMHFAVLSQKTGISEVTIKRILSGRHPSAHFDHVLSIAAALGVTIEAKITEDAETLRRRQAEQKAKHLMKLVRGNNALEGQSLSRVAYKRMVDKTALQLLSGPKKRLWSE